MIKHVTKNQYRNDLQHIQDRYTAAGLTHLDCLTDITNGKGEVCYADGYADAILIAGGSLLIGGLICKWLANQEAKYQTRVVNNRLALARFANSIVPPEEDSDDDTREENNG